MRSLALLRETLAWHDALADFAFAMQGLGSAPIKLAGSAQLKARYLPGVAAGYPNRGIRAVRTAGRFGRGCDGMFGSRSWTRLSPRWL